jgi:hypothetical protein
VDKIEKTEYRGYNWLFERKKLLKKGRGGGGGMDFGLSTLVANVKVAARDRNRFCNLPIFQEFGITECSTSYALFEVTVENGFVRQKRLADRSGKDTT